MSARERARAARARADAARAERDRAVEAAAAAFFAASDDRERVLERIAALHDDLTGVERRMGAQVVALGDLGEPAGWQRELLGVDEPERKRLRGLAERVAAPGTLSCSGHEGGAAAGAPTGELASTA